MALTTWKPMECIKTREDAILYMESVIEDVKENGLRDIDMDFFFISLNDITKLCKEKGWMVDQNTANDCIIEILESYMTFVTIAERTISNYAELPDKIELMFKTLVNKTRQNWLPILNKALEQRDNK